MSPIVKTDKPIPMPVQMAAVVVGLILLAAVAYFALVVPKKNDLKKADARVTELQSQIQQGTSEAAIAEMQSKIRVADVFRLTKAMPDSNELGTVILELSALADQAGIQFQSIRPGTPSVQSSYVAQPIDVVFQGSFWELSDFLGRLRSQVLVHEGELQTTGRLFTVDELSFTQGVDGFPQINAELTIDAYVYATAPTTSTTETTTTSTTTSTTSTTSTAPSSSALGARGPVAAAGEGARS
jgi:Tfp pilus assembly protein PilO